MMTLPKFSNPTISVDEQLTEQRRLHKQADKMLSVTKLLNVLGIFGTLHPIGGSYEYGLMVYPDLDLELVVPELDKKFFSEIVSKIVACDFVRKVSTADTVNFKPIHSGRPKGYWLGIEIPFDDFISLNK